MCIRDRSYAVITMDSMELYIDESKLDDELKASLSKDGVHLHPYNDCLLYTSS